MSLRSRTKQPSVPSLQMLWHDQVCTSRLLESMAEALRAYPLRGALVPEVYVAFQKYICSVPHTTIASIAQVCKHKFSYTPLYAPDAPPQLPWLELVWGLGRRSFSGIRIALRVSKHACVPTAPVLPRYTSSPLRDHSAVHTVCMVPSNIVHWFGAAGVAGCLCLVVSSAFIYLLAVASWFHSLTI